MKFTKEEDPFQTVMMKPALAPAPALGAFLVVKSDGFYKISSLDCLAADSIDVCLPWVSCGPVLVKLSGNQSAPM